MFLLVLFQDGRRIIGINLDLSQMEENFKISEEAVKKLSNLRFLNIYSSDLPHPDRLHTMQGLNCQYFGKLISLRWMHFQETSFPSTFNSEFLVEINMHDSKLQKLWEGTKVSDFGISNLYIFSLNKIIESYDTDVFSMIIYREILINKTIKF